MSKTHFSLQRQDLASTVKICLKPISFCYEILLFARVTIDVCDLVLQFPFTKAVCFWAIAFLRWFNC